MLYVLVPIALLVLLGVEKYYSKKGTMWRVVGQRSDDSNIWETYNRDYRCVYDVNNVGMGAWFTLSTHDRYINGPWPTCYEAMDNNRE